MTHVVLHRAAFALPEYVQTAIRADAPVKAKSTAARRPAKVREVHKG